MADIPMSDEPLVLPEPAGPPARGLGGLVASRQARIAIIIGGVVALLAVVGAVVAIVLLNFGQNAVEQATVNNLNAALASKPAATTTRTVETTAEGSKLTLPVTNQDVFVSRDPFKPVLKELPQTVESSETTIPASERNVLVLQDIVTVNGELRAILKWDGVLFTSIAPGQQLGSSPWKVLTITKTTVTLLYGDVQVTLSIGEGVQKG
jgi:hypothetical protein